MTDKVNARELRDALAELRLTQDEFAAEIEVDARTVRRWLNGETPVSGVTSRLVRAWLRLARSGVGWQADVMVIGYDDFAAMREQLAKGRNFATGFFDR